MEANAERWWARWSWRLRCCERAEGPEAEAGCHAKGPALAAKGEMLPPAVPSVDRAAGVAWPPGPQRAVVSASIDDCSIRWHSAGMLQTPKSSHRVQLCKKLNQWRL